ncbi:MAG: Alginate lyase [Rariglobus sp.]|jgi:hypothetical protein|nr:Alginate lyase [Rariglobus sp.]
MKTLGNLLRAAACAIFVLAHVRAEKAPLVFAYPAEVLVSAKQCLAAGDESLAPALAALRAEADKMFAEKPASVLDKTMVAASGNKRDYFSMGPYWWPDPAKPDGLPYVRRDGEVNPDNNKGTDPRAFGRTTRSVWTLGLMYYLTGKEVYAEKAALLTRTWFLDPEKGMNPNLQYAQAIPGITTGRDIGIIDAHRLIEFTDGIALIAGSAAWTEDDDRGLKAWISTYLDWLLTSDNGKSESKKNNNHGTWYDAQATQLALFVGKNELAKTLVSRAMLNRIPSQIEPDGRQPHELARTRSLHYSTMNLRAFLILASQGERVGLDMWAFSTEDGRSLAKAAAFLAPYADPSKAWIKQDIADESRMAVREVLARAALRIREPAVLASVATAAKDEEFASESWRLFAPILDGVGK